MNGRQTYDLLLSEFNVMYVCIQGSARRSWKSLKRQASSATLISPPIPPRENGVYVIPNSINDGSELSSSWCHMKPSAIRSQTSGTGSSNDKRLGEEGLSEFLFRSNLMFDCQTKPYLEWLIKSSFLCLCLNNNTVTEATGV